MNETRESIYEAKIVEAKLEHYKFYYIYPGALCLAIGDDVVHVVSTSDIVSHIQSWEVRGSSMTIAQAHEQFPQYSINFLNTLVQEEINGMDTD